MPHRENVWEEEGWGSLMVAAAGFRPEDGGCDMAAGGLIVEPSKNFVVGLEVPGFEFFTKMLAEGFGRDFENVRDVGFAKAESMHALNSNAVLGCGIELRTATLGGRRSLIDLRKKSFSSENRAAAKRREPVRRKG